MDYDVIVIGAGVVGLACAEKLARMKLNTLVIEKHNSFGCETSSRNSEVLHAGLYYPEDSLKAKLCVKGNRTIGDWCVKHNIPFNKIGKYVIASGEEEDIALQELLAQANKNGVENIDNFPIDKFRKIEPNVKASSVLFSQNTGIVNTHKLMESLMEFSRQNNCDYAFNHRVVGIIKNNDLYYVDVKDVDGNNFYVNSKYIVNAAGLNSDLVAAVLMGNIEKLNYGLQYCKGHYFRVRPGKAKLVNHLIYPVALKNHTGLGVHITLELDGGMKLGPDVKYLNDRTQNYDVPESLREPFFNSVSKYLDNIEIEDIYPDQSGIRPKLQKEGEAFRDFVIKEESENGFPNFINLIGIESPGLTSSLEIAEMAAGFIE